MVGLSFSRRRMFISLDGVDGAGKSTQIKLLCDAMTVRGHEVSQFRDPGSTKLGEAVREILLHRWCCAHGFRQRAFETKRPRDW